MKVLMVGVSPNRVGGMWTVSENYLKSKKFCKKTNLRYIATSTDGSIYKRFLFMLLGFVKIIHVLSKMDVDIVHVHMAEKGSVYRKGVVVRMAKIFRSKTIIHMHAGPFMDWYDTQSKFRKEKIRKILLEADKTLVLGEYWKKEMSTIIPEQKIAVLYNGVKVPKENLYKFNSRNIIFMGRMTKEKGIFDLIEAIKKIDMSLSEEIKVQFCGNDESGLVREKINEIGLENRIQLLGWINEDEKNYIYQNAMINVLPSYFEGLSMTVIEAMANGVPTITTNISTMAEILGEKATFVEPGDVNCIAKKILQYVTDATLRRNSSNYEYTIVKDKFSIERNIQLLMDVYTEICR